jgi:hypothetical protein
MDVTSENGLVGGWLLRLPGDEDTMIDEVKQLSINVALSKLHSYNICELILDAKTHTKKYIRTIKSIILIPTEIET